MSPDLFRPRALPGSGDRRRANQLAGRKGVLHPRKPGPKQPLQVLMVRARSVHTCGLSRCLETSFRRSTTIG